MADRTTSAPATTVETHRVELALEGMTCAACATRIERKLTKADGVIASVNYATATATIDAPASLTTEDLCAIVDAAGYSAVPATRRPSPRAVDAAHRRAQRDLLRRLAVSVLLFIPVMDLSVMFAVVPATRFTGWNWLLLALSLPVVTYGAWPFHRAAAHGLRRGAFTMDTLVSSAVLAATLMSMYTMFTPSQLQAPSSGVLNAILHGDHIYFEAATGVTTFVLAGRFLEARAKRRAGDTLGALAALAAHDVTLLNRRGQEIRVPVDRLATGDRFIVRPGETIATDGTIVEGASAVDASAMTGEPMPEEKNAGDAVLGGTVAVSGRMVVEATAVGADTALARMTALVEAAQSDKAAAQRLADRIASVFVPVVFVLSALTFLGWLALGGRPPMAAAVPALAVLVIACPCALGLATPTALMVAAGRGATVGIFLKGHTALEATRAIDTLVFDKTGTLTEGCPSVSSIVAEDRTEDELLLLAAGVEQGSEHALGEAIVRAATDRGLPVAEVAARVEDFRARAGRGVRARVDGQEVLLGRPLYLSEEGVAVSAELDEAIAATREKGASLIVVAVDGRAVGVLGLTDTVKPSAAPALSRLREQGLRSVIITGDTATAAHAVARQVGVAEQDVYAGTLPEDKVARLKALQASGHSVAMVGDGINDAPALAAADLGMAVASGADVALGAADLVLVRRDLMVVPDAMELSRATLRVIRGNLAWAFGYNVAAIPLAAAGLLSPLISAAAMALSSFFVVSNSLRLRSAVSRAAAMGSGPAETRRDEPEERAADTREGER